MMNKIFLVTFSLIFSTIAFAGDYDHLIINGRPSWAIDVDWKDFTPEQSKQFSNSFIARCRNMGYSGESCKCAFLVFLTIGPNATIGLAFGEQNLLTDNALMRMPSIIQECKRVGNNPDLLF